MPVNKNRPVGLRYGTSRNGRRWWVYLGTEVLHEGRAMNRRNARQRAKAWMADWLAAEDRRYPPQEKKEDNR
ncbi:MAG: hypothetical protein IJT88_09565 [Kiritimatiellae bacterium]|nr:hypothetical protein [Kiritimatiellia bacterium]